MTTATTAQIAFIRKLQAEKAGITPDIPLLKSAIRANLDATWRARIIRLHLLGDDRGEIAGLTGARQRLAQSVLAFEAKWGAQQGRDAAFDAAYDAAEREWAALADEAAEDTLTRMAQTRERYLAIDPTTLTKAEASEAITALKAL